MKKNELAQKIIEICKCTKEEYLETLELLKNQDEDLANEKFQHANQQLLEASRLHFQMINRNEKLSLQVIYSEDLLMIAGLYQSMIVHFKDLYLKTQNEKERSKWKN